NLRGALMGRLDATEPDAVCTRIVVACELRFGARRKGSDLLTQRVEQLLDTLAVLALDPRRPMSTRRTSVPSSSVASSPGAARTPANTAARTTASTLRRRQHCGRS
ncbi:MAG: hypothetical protein ABIN37_13560, partial [Burkholderiaceae bacterium]